MHVFWQSQRMWISLKSRFVFTILQKNTLIINTLLDQRPSWAVTCICIFHSTTLWLVIAEKASVLKHQRVTLRTVLFCWSVPLSHNRESALTTSGHWSQMEFSAIIHLIIYACLVWISVLCLVCRALLYICVFIVGCLLWAGVCVYVHPCAVKKACSTQIYRSKTCFYWTKPDENHLLNEKYKRLSLLQFFASRIGRTAKFSETTRHQHRYEWICAQNRSGRNVLNLLIQLMKNGSKNKSVIYLHLCVFF